MMASKPKESDSLYSNRPHDHHSKASQTLYQQVISELHNSNSNPKNHKSQDNFPGKNNVENGTEDLVTKLTVRIAVTENELKHAIKERDDAINSNMLIVKAFSGAMAHDDKIKQIKELEDELNKLRLENKALRQRLESQQVLSEAREASKSIDNHIHHRTGNTYVEEFNANVGPDSFSRLFDPSESYDAHLLPLTNQTPDNTSIPSNKLPIISRALSAEQRVNYSDPWEESFDSNSSTIPNTPIVTARTPNRPPPDLEPPAPTKMSTQVITSIDVGFSSLDAAMDSVLGNASPTAIETNPLSEVTLDMDEQKAKHMTGTRDISELPKPKILKAGFDPKGSFKGNEYDSEKRRTQSYDNEVRAPSSRYMYGHHVMREHNQSSLDSVPTDPKAEHQLTALWSSQEEREDAIDTHHQAARKEGRLLSNVFRYGYLYVPNEGDSNYIRTVKIGNISAKIELREVLARVRGGALVKAVFLDTMKLTGGNTVMLQFLNESSANEYVAYATVHPISFGGDDKVADIGIIETPTYPNFHTIRSMRDLGQTRCLAVSRFPKNQSISRLERDIACYNQLRAESLIEIYLDEQDTLHMEFSSTSAAGSAFAILKSWQPYKRLEVFFERDECAGPVEELELPSRPRPPMIPRNRYDPAITPQVEYLMQDHVPGIQRKRLAALTNQPVTIPSFSGKRIKSGTNWADEVNDEVKDNEIVEDVHLADPAPRQFVQGVSQLDDIFNTPSPKINTDENDLVMSNNDTLADAFTSDPQQYRLFLPTFEEHVTRFPNGRLACNTDKEFNDGTVLRKCHGKRIFDESSSETDSE